MLKTAGVEKAGVVRKAAVEALSHLVGREDRKSGQELYPLLGTKTPKLATTPRLYSVQSAAQWRSRRCPWRCAASRTPTRASRNGGGEDRRIGKDAAPAVEDLGRALVEAKEAGVRMNAAIALAAHRPGLQKSDS